MRFLVEFEGPIVNPLPTYYLAHGAVATELGWSTLDEGTFRRNLRKAGQDAIVLPGAGPAKLSKYQTVWSSRLEEDDFIVAYKLQPNVVSDLDRLRRFGSIQPVTLGANRVARQKRIREWALAVGSVEIVSLNDDARRRPGELTVLAEGDTRTLVIAGSDALVRAVEPPLLAVGLTNGACNRDRFFRAGAALTFPDFGSLIEELDRGAGELIRAGLLPSSGHVHEDSR